jgi:hypothetical protein
MSAELLIASGSIETLTPNGSVSLGANMAGVTVVLANAQSKPTSRP